MLYLLYRESKEQADIADSNFKNQVFAANPTMYLELFKNEGKDEEFEVEEIVPSTEEDLEKMMRQLRAEGVIS